MLKYWDAVTHLRYRPQILTRAHYTCGPSTYHPRHVTPHTSAHVASCHALAPPAPRVGHSGAAMWPQCRVATRCGPTRHVSLRVPRQLPLATSACTLVKTPFFTNLNRKIQFKNQINSEKMHKTSEIHNLKYTTPF